MAESASLSSRADKLRVRSYSQTKQSFVTPEARYWKQFKYPVLVQQYAAVTSIAFSATAPYDFAVASSTRVLVYDAATNAVKRTLARFTNVVHGVAMRADGRVLLAGGDEGLVRLCDVNSREILRSLSGHKGAVHATAFLSDSTVVRVWDLATGANVATLSGHEDRVRALCVLSPTLVASGAYDHTLRLWDVRVRAASASSCVACLDHAAPVEALAAFPGGTQVASVGGTTLRVWDALQGAPVATTDNHQKTVTGVVVDAERARVLTCGLDAHVKVYNTQDWHVLHTLKYPAPLLCLALSPAKSHLVAGMVDGMLSIRHRALGASATEGDEDSRAPSTSLFDDTDAESRSEAGGSTSLHDWRYWDRGRTARAQADDYTPHLHAHEGRLRAFETLLAKFQYKRALDAVLEAGDAALVCSMLEELAARAALRVAVAGRSASTLLPLLRFLCAHVTRPSYARLLVPVTELVLDMYASVVGESVHVDKALRRLQRVVRAECAAQKELAHTLGVLDALFAVHTVQQ